LTWGTGDFVFMNDLIAKDWVSMLIGRDDEYLKKPTNTARATFFSPIANLDVAWTPLFAPDTFPNGERLSYFNPALARRAGPNDPSLLVREPKEDLYHGQIAGRLYDTVAGWEWALYGYRGRYGQPLGFDASTGRLRFPRLDVWGASVRGSVLGIIVNGEGAWHRSMGDRGGNDPFLPNSEIRGLLGLLIPIGGNHELGLQGYVEHLLDHEDYVATGGARDRERWWVTVRYMGQLFRQSLRLSLFAFASPNEQDAYLRPSVSYQMTDELSVVLGGNVFFGKRQDTFFAQFEKNTNVYARIRLGL
jgi:hypothetical protein